MIMIPNNSNLNQRQTIQKIKILEYLKSVKTHPTAEKIYSEVKKELPTISLATVYRNLNQMSGEGKIRKLEINNEFHYDADCCHHLHCVCKRCKKIFDIMSCSIPEHISELNLGGFKIDNIDIILYGKCKKCKEADKR